MDEEVTVDDKSSRDMALLVQGYTGMHLSSLQVSLE